MPARSVVVYTSRRCWYCSAAKDLLRRKGVSFEEIDVEADSEQRRRMVELSGRATVPQVFIDGQAFGGYDDIAALDRRGELDAALGLG